MEINKDEWYKYITPEIAYKATLSCEFYKPDEFTDKLYKYKANIISKLLQERQQKSIIKILSEIRHDPNKIIYNSTEDALYHIINNNYNHSFIKKKVNYKKENNYNNQYIIKVDKFADLLDGICIKAKINKVIIECNCNIIYESSDFEYQDIYDKETNNNISVLLLTKYCLPICAMSSQNVNIIIETDKELNINTNDIYLIYAFLNKKRDMILDIPFELDIQHNKFVIFCNGQSCLHFVGDLSDKMLDICEKAHQEANRRISDSL